MVKWLALAVVACQGSGGDAPRVETGSGSAVVAARADARELEGSDEGSARAKLEEPETVDVGKQLAELGAIPAWQAVVDRTLYLSRRGQHGVVFGTLGEAITEPGLGSGSAGSASGSASHVDAGVTATPYTWLVDDTEGNGALAIRVALAGKPAKTGARVALRGAWSLDEGRHWFWAVSGITELPPAAPSESKDARVGPGHAIANGDLPAGSRTISVAKDNELVYFTVVGPPPAIDGDGWPVADELGNPVYALLNLPGERASYGAQDLRTPDERWQLKRGQTYALRIGYVHKHGPDKPATINARTAPVRVK